MSTFEETRTKYYTISGIESLTNRLKTVYSIYLETPEDKYPVTFQMFGFPPLFLKSKEEALGHINELQQILMVTIEDNKGD